MVNWALQLWVRKKLYGTVQQPYATFIRKEYITNSSSESLQWRKDYEGYELSVTKTTFFLCGVSKKKHLKAVDKLLRRTEKYFCMDQKRPCKITKMKQLQVHLITHADDSYTGSRVILQKRRHSEVSNLERSMIGWVVLPCFL